MATIAQSYEQSDIGILSKAGRHFQFAAAAKKTPSRPNIAWGINCGLPAAAVSVSRR
jgi:hypothetical protein